MREHNPIGCRHTMLAYRRDEEHGGEICAVYECESCWTEFCVPEDQDGI